MSNYDAVLSSIDKFDTIVKDGVAALTEQSLHEYTAPLNFNALYLVDERVANSTILKDLIALHLMTTTARITQVFELKNTIKGISIIDYIKSARLGIKENKSLFRRIFGLESIVVEGEDIPPETNSELIKKNTFGNRCIETIEKSEVVEATGLEDTNKSKNIEDVDKPKEFLPTSINNKSIIPSGADSTISNYAVGAMFDVTLESLGEKDKEKAVVTLSLRISPVAVNPDVVKAILSIGSYKNTLLERFYSFRAGDISLLQFLTLSDIVEQQTAILLKDKSGYYREILQRQKKNLKDGISSLLDKKKIERAKTIGGLIIDSQTLAEAEVELGGTFDDPNIRNKVFLTTSASTISVIDNGWETVKIYYRGVDYVETYSFNQIRRSGNGGVKVEDLLEIFRRGGAPKL